MKTILALFGTAFLSLGTVGNLAVAAPGEMNDADSSQIEILESQDVSCVAQSGFCLTPGARTTIAAPSPASVSHGLHMGADSPPRFSRTVNLASRTDQTYIDDSVPWTIDINAMLRHRALAGNAVFLISDAKDQTNHSSREVTGVFQGKIPAGEKLSARLTLSPVDGFHSGRIYNVRIVQLVRGKEVVLTEGPVQLL